MAKKIIQPPAKKSAKKVAVKKVDFNSPEFKKESKRMDRMPKASGRADFDPTGQLLLAGRAGLAVLGGAGLGGGVSSKYRFQKGIEKGPSKPGGLEAPSIEEYKEKPRYGLGAKTPKKLGKPTRKSNIKKK
jgi:hypothetical protein